MGLFNWFKKKKVETTVQQDVKVEQEAKIVETPVEETLVEETPEQPKVVTPRKFIYHVSHHKDGWKVKKSGGQKAIKIFRTQAEAIEYAKHLSETHDTTYQIHKKDGSIRKKTY